jgi:hypothetical protein
MWVGLRHILIPIVGIVATVLVGWILLATSET